MTNTPKRTLADVKNGTLDRLLDKLFHDNSDLTHEEQVRDFLKDIRRSLLVIMFCAMLIAMNSF